MNRPLASEEARLIRWMLENGEPDGRKLLPHLVHESVRTGAEAGSEVEGLLRVVEDVLSPLFVRVEAAEVVDVDPTGTALVAHLVNLDGDAPVLAVRDGEPPENAILAFLTGPQPLLGRSARRSNRRHRTTVDQVFASVDRGRTIRDEKRDQLGDLFGTIGTADGDAAERVHQALARPALVDALLFGETEDEPPRRSSLGETGRHSVDADPLRTHLVRQPLAVRRQCRLRRGIRERRLVERKATLGRRHMVDRAGALLQH